MLGVEGVVAKCSVKSLVARCYTSASPVLPAKEGKGAYIT